MDIDISRKAKSHLQQSSAVVHVKEEMKVEPGFEWNSVFSVKNVGNEFSTPKNINHAQYLGYLG